MSNNPMCDGSRCSKDNGEVRIYPTGGGGNMILCYSCWVYENKFNYRRGVETENPQYFAQHDWNKSKIYRAD